MKKFKFHFVIFITILVSCNKVNKKEDQKTIVPEYKKEYFENGNVKTHVGMKNGIEHGVYFEYHEDGSLAVSGLKINGKKNGLWKSFDKKRKIIFVKQLYNDNLVYELNKEDFKFRKTKLNKKIKIDVPYKWKVNEYPDSKQILLTARKECDENIEFCPTFSLTLEKREKSFELKKYKENTDSILQMKFSNYRILKERDYSFKGITYYEKIYTGVVNNIQLGGISTWVFKNDKIYVITGFALNEKENSFLKFEGLFKDVTNSFELN
jgi:hypothetical protein